MEKREPVALLSLSPCCLVIVLRLFLAVVPCVCLQLVIVVYPDHPYLIFLVLTYFVHLSVSKSLAFAG